MTGRLERLAETIRDASGIVVGRRQLGSLSSALSRALPGVEQEEALDALEDGDGASGLLARVIDEVTVKESFFMREAAQLRAVEWPALLASAKARGSDRVRVWSAACAGGEEPYTLALLACDALGSQRPPVEILATDISEIALTRARRGRYGPRAIRAVEPEIVERHFESDDAGVWVKPALRELVSFHRHNLARDPEPPAGAEPFDLVVCRNVLIYFDAPAVGHALSTMERALQPGGILLLGSADRLCVPRGRARPSRQAAARRPAGKPTSDRGRTHDRPSGRRGSKPRSSRRESRGAAPAGIRERSRPPVEGLAGGGDIPAAAAEANSALAADPLSGEAYFLRANVEIAMGDPRAAVESLRAALYATPKFAVAAFQLGRAYEAIGERRPARRAYEQALRTLDRDDARHAQLLGDVDIGDVAYACGVRIAALAELEKEPGA